MSGHHNQDQATITGGVPQTPLRRAMDAFQAGDLERAHLLARALADEAPQQEDAWRIMAAVAQRQGRMGAAVNFLRDGIERNPNSVALFTMLGLLLRDGGRMQDAETALRHALTLGSDTSETALPLGNLLAQQGRLHEAEEVFRTAAAQAPNDGRFPLQLGRLMMTVGRADLAKEAFERATQLSRAEGSRPDSTVYVDAASHLGSLLLREGRRPEALNWLYDAVQMGGDEAARNQFAECVANIPFAESLPILKPLLVRAIAGHWTDPADLMRVSAQQLMYDPEFSSAAERIGVVETENEAPLESTEVVRVTRDPLLRAMLESAIIPDAAFEDFLTRLRRMLLKARADTQAAAARGAEGLLAFAVALARQCFLTEYAYAVSDEEAKMVAALDARIAAASAAGTPPALSDIASLAAYRPLHGLGYAQALADQISAPALEPLIRTQLREPLREAALRATIPTITPITDATSDAVRQQYEENPYPRWVDTAVRTRPFTLEQWLHGTFPHLPPDMLPTRDPETKLSILVAGCGTGQETIATATRFANSDVLAVDLSLASLSYAVRKAEEIGLKNITYAQADLLELDGLGRQFDIVECAGVLHHLAEPLAGWRVLTNLTKPGGYMLMALYSELGRRDLNAVTAFIAEHGYGTTQDELRRFRKDILALPNDHPARRRLVVLRDDFYNLSMLRDLAFHVQERRFTIPEIGKMLDALGLEFCGFSVEPELRTRFEELLGTGADPRSLSNWEKFETEYPDAFSAMYHFLVRKPD